MIPFVFFFFNDTATTEIYTLSLHDALPILVLDLEPEAIAAEQLREILRARLGRLRSEEHTSELQSQSNLVCRLLLEKKKRNTVPAHYGAVEYVSKHRAALPRWSSL